MAARKPEDVSNKFMVGMAGGANVLIAGRARCMTKREALILAAWLVVVAGDGEVDDFLDILWAVQCQDNR